MKNRIFTKRNSFYFVCALVLSVLLLLVIRKPLLDRIWDDDVNELAQFTLLANGSFNIEGVRNWNYSEEQVVSKGYLDAIFDPEDIEKLWFYEQILDSTGLLAHTFLVFQFSEDYDSNRYVGVSVETRREIGEQYSLLHGLLQGFEVTHTWALEQDLVERRVLYLDYDLTRHEVVIPRELLSEIFVQFAKETQKLHEKPVWYNTVTNNCTNSLIHYLRKLYPDSLPFHYSFIFTGHIDNYLQKEDYIRGGGAYINKETLNNFSR